MIRLARAGTALALIAVAALGLPATASAHPLGNFTVNRALAVAVTDTVEITAVLDMAEIPAFEAMRELDADGDEAVSPDEGAPWADATCDAWRGRVEVAVDGSPLAPRTADEPTLSFPPGAGGLETLRLECRWALDVDGEGPHRLTLLDTTVDARTGWREVTAVSRGGGSIATSDVPSRSETDLLTSYPEAGLESPSDVRGADLTFALGAEGGTTPAGRGPVAGERETATDPLAALVGGELSPIAVLLALALSLGLGAAHALSPGHGKTLVAAYVLGAGGTARAAVQIGLWVAISHTAGVFVLGVVTLAASEWLLPEVLIGWLSLGSGVIVTGLGLLLLWRVLRRRSAAAAHARAHSHSRDHDHDHGHGHAHPHPHAHDVPAAGELSWRTAIALGFAGGAVPSASALIVLLVAISTDRLLLGAILIGSFGIGMAAVLGGLAFAIARMRRLAATGGSLATRPIVRRATALAPGAAGLVVLLTGLAFTAAAVGQLA